MKGNTLLPGLFVRAEITESLKNGYNQFENEILLYKVQAYDGEKFLFNTFFLLINPKRGLSYLHQIFGFSSENSNK